MARKPGTDSGSKPDDFAESPEDDLIWAQESADPDDIRTT